MSIVVPKDWIEKANFIAAYNKLGTLCQKHHQGLVPLSNFLDDAGSAALTGTGFMMASHIDYLRCKILLIMAKIDWEIQHRPSGTVQQARAMLGRGMPADAFNTHSCKVCACGRVNSVAGPPGTSDSLAPAYPPSQAWINDVNPDFLTHPENCGATQTAYGNDLSDYKVQYPGKNTIHMWKLIEHVNELDNLLTAINQLEANDAAILDCLKNGGPKIFNGCGGGNKTICNDHALHVVFSIKENAADLCCGGYIITNGVSDGKTCCAITNLGDIVLGVGSPSFTCDSGNTCCDPGLLCCSSGQECCQIQRQYSEQDVQYWPNNFICYTLKQTVRSNPGAGSSICIPAGQVPCTNANTGACTACASGQICCTHKSSPSTNCCVNPQVCCFTDDNIDGLHPIGVYLGCCTGTCVHAAHDIKCCQYSSCTGATGMITCCNADTPQCCGAACCAPDRADTCCGQACHNCYTQPENCLYGGCGSGGFCTSYAGNPSWFRTVCCHDNKTGADWVQTTAQSYSSGSPGYSYTYGQFLCCLPQCFGCNRCYASTAYSQEPYFSNGTSNQTCCGTTTDIYGCTSSSTCGNSFSSQTVPNPQGSNTVAHCCNGINCLTDSAVYTGLGPQPQSIFHNYCDRCNGGQWVQSSYPPYQPYTTYSVSLGAAEHSCGDTFCCYTKWANNPAGTQQPIVENADPMLCCPASINQPPPTTNTNCNYQENCTYPNVPRINVVDKKSQWDCSQGNPMHDATRPDLWPTFYATNTIQNVSFEYPPGGSCPDPTPYAPTHSSVTDTVTIASQPFSCSTTIDTTDAPVVFYKHYPTCVDTTTSQTCDNQCSQQIAHVQSTVWATSGHCGCLSQSTVLGLQASMTATCCANASFGNGGGSQNQSNDCCAPYADTTTVVVPP